jgi:hypothetical protein
VRGADVLDRPARVLIGVADFRPGFGGGRGHDDSLLPPPAKGCLRPSSIADVGGLGWG